MKILIQPQTREDWLAIPDGTIITFFDSNCDLWSYCIKKGNTIIENFNTVAERAFKIDDLDFEDSLDGSFAYYEYKSDGNK